MKEILREFYNCLNDEERDLAREVATDRLGMLMRIAINEVDLHVDRMWIGECTSDDDLERSYLMRLGVVRIINLAMLAHQKFDAPTVTMRRDPIYSAAVTALIGVAGAIEHGRRVAQSLTAEGATIEKLLEGFRIVLPAKRADFERHERELERFHKGKHKDKLSEAFETTVNPIIGKEVRSLLRDLVYPFAKHFIGYDADPTLDFYFFGHAYNQVLFAKGYDTFHFSTTFGGITFANYKLAATFIVSTAIKHRAFVAALIEKEPSIRLEDILTVSVETAGFLEGMRDFVNAFGEKFEGHVPLTDQQAKTIFESLSVGRHNLALIERPGSPFPPLIQCSDEHVIRPLAGATGDQVMLFLLNSLQHRFPKEYDRAQRAREGVLQRAVEEQIRTVVPMLQCRGNIKLKQAGRDLTDVDLVISDISGDRLILVQLKHQDPYGEDLAAMLSRTGRLNQQVDDWLRKVQSWLAAASTAEVCATLRLRSRAARPEISLLVLTRHYAHSLHSIVGKTGATFANWNQLVTAIAQLGERGGMATLCDLLEELRSLSGPIEEEYISQPSGSWIVGKTKFTIERDQQ